MLHEVVHHWSTRIKIFVYWLRGRMSSCNGSPRGFFVTVIFFLSLGPRRLAGAGFSTVPGSIPVPVLPDGAGDACRGPS